jgi:hypothetical protein
MNEASDLNLKSQLVKQAELPDAGLAEIAANLFDWRTNFEEAVHEDGRFSPGEIEQMRGDYRALASRTVDALLTRVEDALRPYRDVSRDAKVSNRSADEDGKLEKAFEQLGYIGQLGGLTGEKSERFEKAQQLAADLQDTARTEARFQRKREEIFQRWQAAAAIAGSNADQCVKEYRAAADAVQEELMFPYWSSEQRTEWYKLGGEAREKYNDIRGRYAIPTTEQSAAKFNPLYIVDMLAFEKYPKGSAQRLLNYWAGSSRSAVPKLMDVSEAIAISRRRLQQIFWKDQVAKYVSEAEQALEEHNPRSARQAMAKCERLAGLGDDRIGVTLLSDDENLIKDTNDKIKPIYEKWHQADELVNEAYAAIERRDPLEADRLRGVAKAAYPYHKSLDDLSEQIMTTAEKVLPDEIGALKDRLCDYDQWSGAAGRATRVSALLALGTGLEKKYGATVRPLQNLQGRIAVWLLERAKASSIERLKLLQGLEADYPNYWSLEKWQPARDELTRLDAGTQYEPLLLKVKEVRGRDATLKALGDTLTLCNDFLKTPPSGLDDKKLTTLRNEGAKLGQWYKFAVARDELAQSAQDGGGGADLAVVEDSIAAAAKSSDVNLLTELTRLRANLRPLKAADDEAKRRLTAFNTLYEKDEIDALRQVVKEVQPWTQKTSSVKNEFANLRMMARQGLLDKLKRTIEAEVDRTRDDIFAKLDINTFNDLLSEARGHAKDSSDPNPEWIKKAEIALSIATVLKDHKTRSNGISEWINIEKAWKAVVVRLSGDDELKRKCNQYAEMASLRLAIARARSNPDVEEAVRDLKPWIELGNTQDDKDLLLLFAERNFEAARKIASTKSEIANNDSIGGFLNSTRTYSAKLRYLGGSSSLPDMADWDKLLDIRRKVGREMGAAPTAPALTAPLTAAQCSKLVGFIESGSVIIDAESKDALHFFWTQQKAGLITRLGQRQTEVIAAHQTAKTDPILDLLDVLLARTTLEPENQTYRAQLRATLTDAVHQLKNLITDYRFDTSATKFFARNPGVANASGTSYTGIVEAQLAEIDQLTTQITSFEEAGVLVARQLGSATGAPALLAGAPNFDLTTDKNMLAAWRGDLVKLRTAIETALGQIEAGLRNEQGFGVAGHILLVGTLSGVNAIPIDQQFNLGPHPDVAYARTLLAENMEFRERQKAFRQRIEVGLKYVDVIALPASGSTAEEEPLKDLRVACQAGEYPIGFVVGKISDMMAHDPRQRCGEQQAVRYLDSSNGSRELRGVGPIKLVLEAYLKQVNYIAKWLAAYKGSPHIKWADEKEMWAEERNTGPEGLETVSQKCKQMLTQDSMGAKDGRWTLHRMGAYLTEENLKTGMAKANDGIEPALCQAAQLLDEQRAALEATCKAETVDCALMLADVVVRADRHDEVWSRVLVAHANIREWQNRGWLRRLFDRSNIARSQDWADFQEAAAEYCRICPKRDEFLAMVADLKKNIGLEFDCPKEGVTP